MNVTAAASPRVIVERLRPEIDGGRFPIKRTAGDTVAVTVDAFADGHDLLAGVLKYRHVPAGTLSLGDDVRETAGPPSPDNRAQAEPAPRGARSSGDSARAEPGLPAQSSHPDVWAGSRGRRVSPAADPAVWTEVPLVAGVNDAWHASFTVSELGSYEYTAEFWIDRFGSWQKELIAKTDAGQDVASELLEGAALVRAAADPDLRAIADLLASGRPQADRVAAARDPQLRAAMAARPDRSASTVYDRVLRVAVDRERARFSAWYEMFPRSCTPDPGRSGTFREAESRLPDIAAMGFDVVYLPPIHPIGHTHRKGRNNTLTAGPGDPGSPWAIGAETGGHTAVDPGLGTLDDFDRFVDTASHLGLEVALDIAFQASPDHPWVREHPEWFKHRPDGSIKYAENPPKKYQDIYPLDFDSPDWRGLWDALRDVFLFWIDHGVKIFRVDNPHTKPFRFWEWCLADIRRRHPDTIFLAEAFTRPKPMQYLAKLGYTQSYTYFTWRNSADELRSYLTELTTTEVAEYFRPNFFANTPDILHEYLQHGGRPAFEVRLVLAATLAASYGIYSGFELCEHVAVRAGSEEYLDSEKYQIKPRDWNQPGNLKELVAQMNAIRRAHPALQQNATLRFHLSDNNALLWYSKTAERDRPAAGGPDARPDHQPSRDAVFVVANTTPHATQDGWLELPISELGIPPDAPYVVEDLLDGATYTWRGAWNYVRLDPTVRMAHVFIVRDL